MNEPNPYAATQQTAEGQPQDEVVSWGITFGWQLIPAFLCLLFAAVFGFVACMVIGGAFGVIGNWDQQSYPTSEFLTSFIITLIVASLTVVQLLAAWWWLCRRYTRATTYMVAGLACHYLASSVKRDSLYNVVKTLTIFLGLES